MHHDRQLGTFGLVVALSLTLGGCDFIANLGNGGLGNARQLGATATADTATTKTTTTTTKTDKGTDSGTTTTDGGKTTTDGSDSDTGTTKKKDDPCPVDPTVDPMGPATDYNLFVFGDYDADATDVGGAIAVGGNMSVASFGAATALPGSFKGVSLSVGDDLDYQNGQVFQGDVEVGGAITGPFNVLNGSSSSKVKGVFDAGNSETDMIDISDHLAGLTVNGSWTEGYGQVTLTGTDADLNVIDLDLDAIKDQWAKDGRYTYWAPSAVNSLTIDAPASSTVVINVSGDTSVFLQRHGVFLVGVTGDNIVFNFADTKLSTLVITASPVYGTILAPYTTVEIDNTQMHGQLIAATVTGTGELHELSFAGDICEEDDKKKKDKGTDSGKKTKKAEEDKKGKGTPSY